MYHKIISNSVINVFVLETNNLNDIFAIIKLNITTLDCIVHGTWNITTVQRLIDTMWTNLNTAQLITVKDISIY